LKITGILNNVFRQQKTLRKTRIKLYNTLALPVMLYGSETWTVKARDVRRITAAEMKYMRRTAGYIWTDYETSAQIAKELKITPILEKLIKFRYKYNVIRSCKIWKAFIEDLEQWRCSMLWDVTEC